MELSTISVFKNTPYTKILAFDKPQDFKKNLDALINDTLLKSTSLSEEDKTTIKNNCRRQ